MRVAIIGGGPRGTSVIERLIARANDPNFALTRPARDDGHAPELHIDIFDPYPIGAGQVWRNDQSPWFINNTSARNNTLYTDADVPLDGGPVVTGPSVAEWAEQIAPSLPLADDPDFARELRDVYPWQKPSRRLQGEYFHWVFEQVRAQAPDWVHITTHRATVTDVRGTGIDPQVVTYLPTDADQTQTLLADVVVSAQGFVPDRLADDSVDGTALPARLAADLPLERIPAGASVAVSGLGATFFDFIGTFFEGRGGRFERDAEGTLIYHPSGREPRIFAGSRSGLPHRSQRLNGPDQYAAPSIPLFAPEATAALIEEHRNRHDLTFVDDLWPAFLVQAGMVFRTRAEHLGLDVDFDWERLVDPTLGRDFANADEWNAFIEEHFIREFISLSAPDASPWTGVHQLAGHLRALTERARIAGVFTSEAEQRYIERDLLPAANILASGPPSFRFERLAALRRQGFVQLIGPELRVRAEDDGYTAWSPRVAGSEVHAQYWLAGHQAWGTLSKTEDALLAGWLQRGEATLAPLGWPADARNVHSLAVTPQRLHPITEDGTVLTQRVVIGCVAGQYQPGAGQAAAPHSGGSFLAGTDTAAQVVWERLIDQPHAAENAGIAESNSLV